MARFEEGTLVHAAINADVWLNAEVLAHTGVCHGAPMSPHQVRLCISASQPHLSAHELASTPLPTPINNGDDARSVAFVWDSALVEAVHSVDDEAA
eukprot:m.211677 g.211677  ORF g.211677 m.211677 type:complete len:96 (+) comp15066_c1_seq3:160-447(+)